jgi:hypothetical protein
MNGSRTSRIFFILILVLQTTVSAQKITPSLKFWRVFFFIFAAPPDFDTITSNFLPFSFWPFGSWQKNYSSIQGLEGGFISSQLKLKIVKYQNLQG